jgi:hypothetical protein
MRHSLKTSQKYNLDSAQLRLASYHRCKNLETGVSGNDLLNGDLYVGPA